MHKKYLLVTSLYFRSYIAECLWLFRVVVEGPERCLMLVGFSCDVWDRQSFLNFAYEKC